MVIIWDNWENLNGSVGQMTVIYSSYLPDLSDMLWLFRRIPLFIGDIHLRILGLFDIMLPTYSQLI